MPVYYVSAIATHLTVAAEASRSGLTVDEAATATGN